MFKTFFALFNTDPTLASWENAIKVAELIAKKLKVKGARTNLLEARTSIFNSRASLGRAVNSRREVRSAS